MLNKCYFTQTNQQLFVAANVIVHGDKTGLNEIFRYFNKAYCNFFVCECI